MLTCFSNHNGPYNGPFDMTKVLEFRMIWSYCRAYPLGRSNTND